MVGSVQYNDSCEILNGKDLVHSFIFLVSITFRRKLLRFISRCLLCKPLTLIQNKDHGGPVVFSHYISVM